MSDRTGPLERAAPPTGSAVTRQANLVTKASAKVLNFETLPWQFPVETVVEATTLPSTAEVEPASFVVHGGHGLLDRQAGQLSVAVKIATNTR